MRRATWLLVVLLLASGCAALKPGAPRMTPSEQQVLHDWQAMADRVTKAYHADPVRVVAVQSSTPVTQIKLDAGQISFSPNVLNPANEFTLAHELGHWIQYQNKSHCILEVFFAACEMDANREAVGILVIGRGLAEEQAFQKVYRGLVKARTFDQQRVMHGHPQDICVEIKDLEHRFSHYVPPVESGCQP